MQSITSDESFAQMKYEKILVVDDEQPILDLMSDFLSQEGFHVTTANSGEEALSVLASDSFALVITDLKMPQMNGLELIRKIRQYDANIVTIIMTGYGTLESAVTAMKDGAYDYILKPFKMDQVIHLIQRGLETQRLREENIRMRETLSLYNMSEVISQTLQRNIILDLTLETIYTAVDADFVNILLFDTQMDDIVEVGHRTAAKISGTFMDTGNLKQRLMAMHNAKQPVLFNRDQCYAFFGASLAEQYRTHSFMSVPILIKGHIHGMINVLNLRGKHRFTEGQRRTVVLISNRTASALENSQLFENLEETLHQTIEGLAKALEAKDLYTHGHSERVRTYAILISRALKLSDPVVEIIGKAALLHDIGKIGVDLTYINKAGKLTNQQVHEFREHPRIGKDILSPIRSLADIVPMVYHHHERFDGSGYPDGLHGDEIPLGARILAIADSYDAMTTDRAYRNAMEYERALEELQRCAGTQFDPHIIHVFIREINRLVEQGRSPYLRAIKRKKSQTWS